jgi:hypothetical protein
VKKLSVLLAFVLLFCFSVKVVFAQAQEITEIGIGSDNPASVSNEITTMTEGVQADKNGQPNSKAFDMEKIRNTFTGFLCLGVDDTECGVNEAKAGVSKSGLPTGNSAISSAARAIAMLYTPQASTEVYIADLARTAGFNIATPAYAQGIGFAALDPILNTWKTFRNMAYIFYVVIFLITGFMIMFRRKISSQAVVTIQQALPNIIISLLAVTFSYAIAGLLIDGMYLAMFLLIAVFQNQVPGIKALALDKNIFQIGNDLLTSPEIGTLGTVHSAIQSMVASAISIPGVKDIIGWIAGLTFAVVFAFALLISIFKLFFELLKTYVAIIIAVVLSPMALMMGALPGNNAFGEWLKLLIAHLAVFPTVLLVLILSFVLKSNTSISQSGGFLPPYLIGQGNAPAISALVSMGMLLVLNEIVVEVKNMGGKGGIIEKLINSAVKNFSEGDVALPTISGAARGAYGGVRGYQELRNQTTPGQRINWRSARDAIINGYQLKDDQDNVIGTVGGAVGGARKGIQGGQRLRKIVDDIRDGRFGDPDNFRSMLEKIEQNQVAGRPHAEAKSDDAATPN